MKRWLRRDDYDTGPTCFELACAILITLTAAPALAVWWIAG